MRNEINQELAQNIIRGKRSKATGVQFERLIDRACGYYMVIGKAKIEKQAEPVHYIRPIGRTGQFVANYAKKSGVDYKGTLQGGKSVCFEAKHTDTDRFSYNRVEKHQLQYLYEHYKLGAECFVLVSFGLTDFYRIPFRSWYNMKEQFGRQYIMQDKALQPYKIQYKQGNILFLEGLQ